MLKEWIVKRKARKGKKLSSEEVRIIFRCGSDNLICYYLRFHSLPEEVHLELLSKSDALIKTYICYRTLSAEAELELFKRSKELAKYYMNKHQLTLAVQKELLKPENQDLLAEFVKHHAFDDDDLVIKFIQEAPDVIVIDYVKEHELSEEAFEILLDRSVCLAEVYAENFWLEDNSVKLYLEKADADQIMSFVDDSIECGISQAGEIALVRTGNVEAIKKYIQHFHLGDCDEYLHRPQEMALFELGNKELLLLYVSLHMPCEKFIAELFKYGDRDVIMALVSAQTLSADEEDMLFDLGIEFVQAYVEHDSLSTAPEKKMAMAYPAEFVKAYVEKYELTNDAEEDLIRRGDVELIKFYIDRYALGFGAQKILVKTLNKELIAYYDKQQGFDDEVWKLIAQTFFLNNL